MLTQASYFKGCAGSVIAALVYLCPNWTAKVMYTIDQQGVPRPLIHAAFNTRRPETPFTTMAWL